MGDLDALDALGTKRRSAAVGALRASNVVLDGPFDRRLTTNRRVSVTALVPETVDVLSVRRAYGGITLSTDLASGPLVEVRSVGARREVWLRGLELRSVLPACFCFPKDRRGRRRSVPLDAYLRRHPGGTLEVTLLVRATRTVPWSYVRALRGSLACGPRSQGTSRSTTPRWPGCSQTSWRPSQRLGSGAFLRRPGSR